MLSGHGTAAPLDGHNPMIRRQTTMKNMDTSRNPSP
jgi:hypothetical protein